MMKPAAHFKFIILTACIIFLIGCGPKEVSPGTGGKLQVLATTSIVGDVVSQIGKDRIDLKHLLPTGVDPHSFNPTPQDITKAVEADVIFANGAGLETFLENLIKSAGSNEKIVYLSEGLDVLVQKGGIDRHPGEDTNNDIDPHTWTNPLNVIHWVDAVVGKLGDLDPANAVFFKDNSEGYIYNLNALDSWIRDQVTEVPEQNRKIVTDHTFFGYFANEYGFEQIGALIPSSSSLAEPTAQELAILEDTIKNALVKAVFVGYTVNPSLAERVAADTGTRLIFIYTGSLGEPGSGVETYLDYMRYNTSAFVDALK